MIICFTAFLAVASLPLWLYYYGAGAGNIMLSPMYAIVFFDYFANASRAESLISMTDISGILRDKDDPNTLIGEITIEEAQQLIESGIVAGGMIPKVECCINAIQWGVNRVFIIDGRISHGILMETLTDEGIGTMFIKGEKTP